MPDHASVPTVEGVLRQTAVGRAGFHEFAIQGRVCLFTKWNLWRALQDAYDPTDPDWQSKVTIDDEGAPGGPGGENFA